MKLLILIAILLMSTAAVASSVYPRLTVWPNSAEVQVWNHTDKDVQCSGSISIWTQQNRYRSHFYHRIVRAKSNDYQRFPNFYYNDPYRNGHHSIYCREIN